MWRVVKLLKLAVVSKKDIYEKPWTQQQKGNKPSVFEKNCRKVCRIIFNLLKKKGLKLQKIILY